MLERPGVTGGQLEVSEVQVEGWARSCGEITVSHLNTQHSALCSVRKLLSPVHCRDCGGDERGEGLRTPPMAESETHT